MNPEEDTADPAKRVAVLEEQIGQLSGALAELAATVGADRETNEQGLERIQKLLTGSPDTGAAAAAAARLPSAGGSTPTDHTTDGSTDDDEEIVTGWAAQADAKQWQHLVDWVDWWIATYDVNTQVLHPCWPAHGAVVEEVAAAWMAWDQAARACAESDWRNNEALAYWHDRYLPGLLHRLETLWSISICSRERHEPAGKRHFTDQSKAFVQVTGESLPDAIATSKATDTGSEQVADQTTVEGTKPA